VAALGCSWSPVGHDARVIERVVVELRVPSDHYQVYLQDEASPCDTAVIWDDPVTTERGFAQGDGLVAITTKRYEIVPLRIEWYPADPGFDWEGIDRVNEGGIEITTRLVAGMPISGVVPVDAIAPGRYAVRSLSWGFDSVESDWVGADHYAVQLWPVRRRPRARAVPRPA
jgi:hypothetical protein